MNIQRVQSSQRPCVRRCVLIAAAACAAMVIFPHDAAAQCPTVPTNVAVQSLGCGVKITWTPSVGLTDHFNIYRSADNTFAHAASVGVASGNATVYNDTPPVDNVNYYYWVGVSGVASYPFSCPSPGPVAGSGAAGLPGLRFNTDPTQGPSASVGCDDVLLIWSMFPDATTTAVYRDDLNGTGPHVIANPAFNTNFYQDSTAAPGRPVKYLIMHQLPCGSRSTGWTTVTPMAPISITSSPASKVVSAGATTTLSVEFTLGGSVRWSRDGALLSDNAHISGSLTPTLTINHVNSDDVGTYSAYAYSSCGAATSAGAVLAVKTVCKVDFNGSGHAEVQDIFLFLSAWFAGCP